MYIMSSYSLTFTPLLRLWFIGVGLEVVKTIYTRSGIRTHADIRPTGFSTVAVDHYWAILVYIYLYKF